MSKDDFIQHLITGMGSDSFGPGRLRKIDQRQWMQVRKAEICRLRGLSYSDLETLYHKSEGLYEMAE